MRGAGTITAPQHQPRRYVVEPHKLYRKRVDLSNRGVAGNASIFREVFLPRHGFQTDFTGLVVSVSASLLLCAKLLLYRRCRILCLRVRVVATARKTLQLFSSIGPLGVQEIKGEKKKLCFTPIAFNFVLTAPRFYLAK